MEIKFPDDDYKSAQHDAEIILAHLGQSEPIDRLRALLIAAAARNVENPWHGEATALLEIARAVRMQTMN